MSRPDHYSWLNPNVCQPGKIGLQWERIAWWLRSICSRESELHLNVLTHINQILLFIEGLIQLPDSKSLPIGNIYISIGISLLSATTLKYDSLFLCSCFLADLCTFFLPHFHPMFRFEHASP